MLIKTVVFIIALISWFFSTKLIFKVLYKLKPTLTTKFYKNLFIVIGASIIVYFYLTQFDATKDISKTLIQSGSLIIALATFSCQRVLSNVVSGLMLSSSKPFDVGDKISLVSTTGSLVVEGIVVSMNTRHVSLKLADDKLALIPNGVVDNLIVLNNDKIELSGRLFQMSCSLDSDVSKAIKLMQETIDKNKLVVKTNSPLEEVLCSDITSTGFVLKSTIWTNTRDDSFRVCSELRIEIYRIWKENNIELVD